jgi:putative sigma-54 modulation protein
MSVSITDRSDLLTNELRLLAERRFLFALSRFESRLNKVDLVVTDENGPRGGIDKTCQVWVTLHGAGEVVVNDRDSDLAKCISRVAERAGRAVARAIEKSQRLDRSRPVFIDPAV